MFERFEIATKFATDERAVVLEGDCREMLRRVPSDTIQSVVIWPAYDLSKDCDRQLAPALYSLQRMV